MVYPSLKVAKVGPDPMGLAPCAGHTIELYFRT